MRGTLYLFALAMAFAAACSSFSASEEDATDAGGAGGPDATTSDDGGNADTGPGYETGACGSRRCIDFDDPSQQVAPFGFDDFVDEVDGGGLSLADGFDSPSSLRARGIGNARAFGEIRFAALPSTLHVRLRVRSDVRMANGGTSAHFLVVTCSGGAALIGKLTFDGDLSAQVGGSGTAITTYVDGEWILVDALVTFDEASHSLRLTHVGKDAGVVVTDPTACSAPVRLRAGAIVHDNSLADFTLSVDAVAIDWN